MKNDITRRDALALGVSAAALAATGASAQSAIKAADVPVPKFAIEKGAFSDWMLFHCDDIGAHVKRKGDGKEFCLGLSELKAVDGKSANAKAECLLQPGGTPHSYLVARANPQARGLRSRRFRFARATRLRAPLMPIQRCSSHPLSTTGTIESKGTSERR